MANHPELVGRTGSAAGRPTDGEGPTDESSNDLSRAMTTKSPAPGGNLTAVDPDPHALRGVRVALVVEAVLVAALGLWGLIAALTDHAAGPSGAPVLAFHFTWPHAVVLLATAVLAVIATVSHGWALRCMTLQAVGYGVMFIVGAGARNWFADPGNDALHGFLALVGLGLVMSTAVAAFTELRWTRGRGTA